MATNSNATAIKYYKLHLRSIQICIWIWWFTFNQMQKRWTWTAATSDISLVGHLLYYSVFDVSLSLTDFSFRKHSSKRIDVLYTSISSWIRSLVVMASPDELKSAISALTVPHKIKNVTLDWKILQMSPQEWFDAIDAGCDHKSVKFTTGNHRHIDTPYWERLRGTERMSFAEFYEKVQSGQFTDRWASHSYKDINSWPAELRDGINFNQLGFDDAKDILFWLGSRGANTPCHYDTYGFNIVVQVFGSKSWLLFPPDAPLTPTRVPFEVRGHNDKHTFYFHQNRLLCNCRNPVYTANRIFTVPRTEVNLVVSPIYFNSSMWCSSISIISLSDLGQSCDVYEVILNPGDILVR